MKQVLLVLTTSGTPDSVIDYAVSKAKENDACLVALYLLETALADEVLDTFSDIGFIGERPSAELAESIMKEYRQRGYEELGRVQIKAMEEAVGYEPVMDQGDYVATVLEMIEQRDVTCAVLVRRKARRLFRYFSRSLADEVVARASCEVVVFTEGELNDE